MIFFHRPLRIEYFTDFTETSEFQFLVTLFLNYERSALVNSTVTSLKRINVMLTCCFCKRFSGCILVRGPFQLSYEVSSSKCIILRTTLNCPTYLVSNFFFLNK